MENSPWALSPRRLGANVLQEGAGAAFGEGRVIDLGVHLDNGDVAAQVFLDGVEERGVGLGIVEGLAGGADDADRFAGDEDANRTLRGIQFLRDDAAQV